MFSFLRRKQRPLYHVLNLNKDGIAVESNEEYIESLKENFSLWFGDDLLRRLLLNRALAVVGSLHIELEDQGLTVKLHTDKTENRIRQREDKTWETEITTTRRIFINE